MFVVAVVAVVAVIAIVIVVGGGSVTVWSWSLLLAGGCGNIIVAIAVVAVAGPI